MVMAIAQGVALISDSPEEWHSGGWKETASSPFRHIDGKQYRLITAQRHMPSFAKKCLAVTMLIFSLGIICSFAVGRRVVTDCWSGLEGKLFSFPLLPEKRGHSGDSSSSDTVLAPSLSSLSKVALQYSSEDYFFVAPQLANLIERLNDASETRDLPSSASSESSESSEELDIDSLIDQLNCRGEKKGVDDESADMEAFADNQRDIGAMIEGLYEMEGDSELAHAQLKKKRRKTQQQAYAMTRLLRQIQNNRRK